MDIFGIVTIPSSSGQVFRLESPRNAATLADGNNPLFIGAGIPTMIIAKPYNETVIVTIPSSSGQVFRRKHPSDGRRGVDLGNNPLFMGAGIPTTVMC